MQNEIQHIVFDVGRVLLHWDAEIPFRHLIPDPKERAWFLDNVCTPDWNLEQDKGRDWAVAEAELIAQFPEHEANIRGFRKHWHEMVPHTIEETVELYSALITAGWDVTLLTNFAADTFQQARGMYPMLNKARGATVSGEIGVLKPDLKIYTHHVNEHGLEPSRTLFIDDSEKNVIGARDAGWHSVLFTDAVQLQTDLEELGIQI